MKQPLLAVAIFYVAGVVLGYWLEAPLLGSLGCAFVMVLAAFWAAPLRPWLMVAAVFLFGWLNMTTRTAVVSPIDLRSLLAGHPALVTVRGQIDGAPSQRLLLRDGVEKSHTLALINVEAIQVARGHWQPAFGRVLSRTSGVLPPPFVEGQRVEATGVMTQPQPPVADGLFNYAEYMNSRGIYYELKVQSSSDWSTSGHVTGPTISDRFRAWGQRTLARGLPEQDESVRLQWAMVLGWQTALTPEVSEPFMRSGTMHIFAISGLHIALIAGILLAVLRAAMMPRFLAGAVVIAIIWFYTGATGWQASAIRSTVMMTVILAGQMLKRPANLLNSLVVAACIILVWQPEQLFQASFQLSFFVVLSLALLVPPIDRLKGHIFKLDPLLPWELRPWWQRRAIKVGGWIWTAFATSLAAMIGSLPLVAYYFHLVTPGSLVANLAIVPVSSLALASGLASLITGDVIPCVTECFNHSGWFFMGVMVWLSEQAAHAPGAWFYVPSPGPIFFLVYYGLIIGICGGWLARKNARWIMLSLVVALAAFWAVKWQRERAWHQLTVLPLHGAHAICIQPARGADEWWINCGDQSAVNFTLKPFWQAKGGNRIDHLLLTHGDARYVGGAAQLDDAFPIRNVYASPVASRSSRYRELLSELEGKSRVHRTATNGALIQHWQILHPDSSDRFPNAADNSVAAIGQFDSLRVLLLMNLNRAGQNAMFQRHPNLRADVVVTGLPQNDEPLPTEWLKVIRPRWIIVADSDAPSHRASPALLSRLRRSGAEIISTRAAGAVTVSIRDKEVRIRTTRTLTGFEPALETGGPGARDE